MGKLVIQLLEKLVGFKTVTPDGKDAIDYCSNFLENLGFRCHALNYNGVSNLYAKLGNSDRNLCFAGHVDVVPPCGNWSVDPFVLTRQNGMCYGRGTNDMKGPLSACLSSISKFVGTHRDIPFSISVLLTSDEEVMGGNGTGKVVQFLQAKNEKITGCILCESCSPWSGSGNYIKIGCRGSLNVDLISRGPQCHVVNSKILGNHIHHFIASLNKLIDEPLDVGDDIFPPSSMEVTSIDTDNDIRNIIPSQLHAKLNIRFNGAWSFENLEKYIGERFPGNVEIIFERFKEPVICSQPEFIAFVREAITEATGIVPGVGAQGGNSDAIFISELADVVEVGSPIAGAHIIDECIAEEHLDLLEKIYMEIINHFRI
ncbi:MAG: succinyl-diaminopimelate desuccinylase [Holosporales bacterium]|nr:succinyl-diaminopimelate desuccinylase [Holosporales bacterium]